MKEAFRVAGLVSPNVQVGEKFVHVPERSERVPRPRRSVLLHPPLTDDLYSRSRESV